MTKEACVSISVGEKRKGVVPPIIPPVPPIIPSAPPKELLADITHLIVYQREAGLRGARVVTWTSENPEKPIPGTGVLTAGEDFDIVVVLRNPYDTTVGGVAYITIDGVRITEGRYTIRAKKPGTFATTVKGDSIPEARSYEICAGVET